MKMLNLKLLFSKILDMLLVKQITNVNATSTTGQFVSGYCYRYGKVVNLRLTCRNTASVAAGGNIWVSTLTSNVPKPICDVTAGSYYGQNALNGSLNTSCSIVVRNASSTALTIGSTNSASISFTYITND